ncbi:C6 zinc finger domain-containing protein [Coniochaeta ligniaria NRRL 30616]|uniref:C6 zinc finger domain-containing protein n=1 Tax=Coniochaeta ligniaria NRRL 30616 TaxID=1408157 RepID=A0A1J7JGA8_9PEZI|nr:C6 zinc finger domain-containing protein [Coniochaeta ligniaria NRRL 30616]
MDTPKRHCWECRRRCLVCDFSQPACKRCSSSGTVCPGYSDAKPPRLRWLAPGRVTSRRHRGKRARSSDTESSKDETTPSTLSELPLESAVDSIPRIARIELRSELSVLLEAMTDNTCIYQDLAPLHELGPNPTIYPILPVHVQSGTLFPDHIRLSIVCMTLSHRINRTRDVGHSKALAESFYHYRGLAIRSLREDIDVEHKRTGDVVLAGIVSLLLSDVQQGYSSDWRHHLDGVQRLIALRGGMRVVARSRSLEAVLLCFVFLAVIGNTTCPASDLIMAQWHLDQVDFILEQYGGAIFPFLMCPPPLFAEIIKINHLRMRAVQQGLTSTACQRHGAFDILRRLNEFSTEQWARSKPCSEEAWMVVGNVYKASVTIYCISSLQALSILPRTEGLRIRSATEGKILQELLSKALSTPGIGRFMLWPLVMLGMEAGNGPTEIRRFVEQRLPEMSRHVGSYAPLTAKAVLERYWASAERDWDACFDKPYAFATQIAVDLSRISPP